MPVKFNDHSANERRRNAEFDSRYLLYMRLNEVIAATDGVQGATVYKFPNLFAAPTPVEAQPVIAVKEPIVINEPLAEVIPITGRVVSQELIDQNQRILLARQLEEKVRNEAEAEVRNEAAA